MKFIAALFVWTALGVVIAAGAVMAAHGSLWLLIFSVLAFLFASARIGCSSH